MKLPKGGGLTAAGVLVVALAGGFVGGAVAMSGGSTPTSPAPVVLHQVAEETTPEPPVAPDPEPTKASAPVEQTPASAPRPVVEAPVSEPAPKVVVAPKTEPEPADDDAEEKAVTPPNSKDPEPKPLPPDGSVATRQADGSISYTVPTPEREPKPKPPVEAPKPVVCRALADGTHSCAGPDD